MRITIDKVLLSMATIFVSATGILGSMMRFDCPELTQSFYDSNPFAIKKRSIDKFVQRTFVFLAVVGLAIQGFPILNPETIPNKVHDDPFYVWIFLAGCIVFPLLAYLLKWASYALARREWLPQVLEGQKDLFRVTSAIVTNGGWRDDQLTLKDNLEEKYRAANLASVAQNLAQIEKLIGIPTKTDKVEDRLARLQKYFEKRR